MLSTTKFAILTTQNFNAMTLRNSQHVPLQVEPAELKHNLILLSRPLQWHILHFTSQEWQKPDTRMVTNVKRILHITNL
jgi:hypothetical protein